MALKPGTKRYLPTDRREVNMAKYTAQKKAWDKLIKLGRHCPMSTTWMRLALSSRPFEGEIYDAACGVLQPVDVVHDHRVHQSLVA